MHRRAATSVLALAAIVGLPAVLARADQVALPPPGIEPIAVVLLVEGHVMFMRGQYDDDDDDGRFAALQLAIDTVAGDAPPGALGAVVTYGNGGRVRREIGPMATLRGDVLGQMRDYDDQIERDLVGGVTVALAELDRATAPHKALVIVGDGADTDPARAAPALRALRARCDASGIEVYAIVHSLDIGDDLAAIGHIASRIRKADKVLELVPAVQRTFRELGSDAMAHRRTGPAPDAPSSSPGEPVGSGRGLAWWLLGAGLVLAALGCGTLIRRRARVP